MSLLYQEVGLVYISNILWIMWAKMSSWFLGEELQERLSLAVLKNLEKLPSFAYKLVPEHVETRSLYRDDYPNVEQVSI